MKKNVFTRIFAIALIAMSIMALTTTSMAASANADNVRVRRGPGTNKALLGEMAKYSTFTTKFMVTGQMHNGTNIWYYVTGIQCACGNSNCTAPSQGYVNASYINNPVLVTPTFTNAASALGTSELSLGSYGVAVYNLQLILLDSNSTFITSISDCDGLYGSTTRKAVREFQSNHSLNNDGIVGPLTRNALWTYGGKTKLNQHGASLN